MGINKGAAICPLDDNTIFVIRRHGENYEFAFTDEKSNGHPLSRQTSVNSYQSKSSRLTLDEDLEALRMANIVFIRHVQRKANTTKKDLPNPQNKYTIVNTSGETMFYAIEVTDAECDETEKPKRKVPELSETNGNEKRLKFVVVNTQGEEVFDVEGPLGVRGYGANVCVRRDTLVLGSVTQTNKASSCHCHPTIPSQRRGPPSYFIETPDGRTLLKVLRQNSWKNVAQGFLQVNDFNILSPDGTICKAKVSRQTNAITLEEYSQTDTYALSFHTTDMDGKLKSLLIAAVLVLDCQLSEKSTQWRDYWSLIFRILLSVFLLAVLIALVVAVVESAVEFQRDKAKRFAGQVPPP